MTRATVFRAALAAAAVSAALLATACTGGPATPPAPPAPVSTSAAPTATAFPIIPAAPVPAAQPPAGAAGPKPADAANAGRQFPGKSLDVRFTAYDRTTNLASFYVTRTVATGGAPQVVDVPGLHRLPLAPAATVTSVDPGGFPFETCPPVHCTPANVLESVVGHYPGGLFARMDVNTADQITAITESAY
ncbi:hypothetical protein [Amycolatopsis sp. NPDC051903]|uniref:hypothetical protein n=1 Tax=Amycolatopsis sp. NPDC051903 TaxID=3363936 RepID=UPI00378B95AD